MDTLVTRCPACSTAFNVNSQQLASAKGAVRCGSCLQVFKATDHVVNDGLRSGADLEATNDADSHEIGSLGDASTKAHTESSAPSDNTPFNDQDSQGTLDTNFESPEISQQGNLPSWEQYPQEAKPTNQTLTSTTTSTSTPTQVEFQELESQLDDDLFETAGQNHVDPNIAEQLDQELDQALEDTLSSSLDIEAPTSRQLANEKSAEIVPFDSEVFAPTTQSRTVEDKVTETRPTENISDSQKNSSDQDTSNSSEPENNDFFSALSELAEQSLDESNDLEYGLGTSYQHETNNFEPSDNASLEATHNAERSTDEPVDAASYVEDVDAGTQDLDLDPEPTPTDDTFNSDAFSTTIAGLDLDLEAGAQEDNHIGVESFGDTALEQPEEQRFTDNDTETFRDNPDTSHSLPQAFSSELPSDGENEPDESWALDMMLKELDDAEDLNEPSKIEQVLDQQHQAQTGPLEDLLSEPARPPTPNETEATVSDDFDSLDLGSELEDALSMDSIRSGNLSLADDSEFNISSATESPEPHNALEHNALEIAPEEQPHVTQGLHKAKELSPAQQAEQGIDPDQQNMANTGTDAINPGQEEPSKSELIDSIEPEPLEMEFRKEKPSWNWLWGTGAFIALLGAIGQFGWINFDTLNREPPYRDAYKIACNYLSCSLPPQVDLNKLKASNLVVRSHPDEQQALVVDMVLLNTANFEQDFPDIQLTFSDIQGRAIASRVFHPNEYLAGELAGAQRMPTQRPIHLSLDIVDPGNEAVNYKVDVR